MHTYAYTHICICIYICMRIYIYTHMCIHIHIYAYLCPMHYFQACAGSLKPTTSPSAPVALRPEELPKGAKLRGRINEVAPSPSRSRLVQTHTHTYIYIYMCIYICAYTYTMHMIVYLMNKFSEPGGCGPLAP